jgi:6,7-dimethyl-8-ribityllumazine synthase
MALDFIGPDFDGVDLRIGIVQARFNEWAGRALAEACVNELVTLGVDEDDITHITVPGALELPVALARLAATEDYDALIAIGCVIRGETFHFEIVARESAQGVARVSADYGLPVANAILTTDTDEQARLRVEEKGRDAARVAVEMANLMLALDEDGEAGGAGTEE